MKKEKYEFRDLSPVGWYIASYIQRFIVLGEDNEKTNKRFLAWENYIIVKACNPDEAYRKALKEARLNCKPYTNTDGQKVQFVFEGFTSLLPIYDKFENGAEIMWVEHKNKTLRRIRAKIKSKKELEVFGGI